MLINYWNTIDWGITGSMLSGLGSLAGSGAITYAAWKAANTFEGWKKQTLEERRIDHATKILAAVYRVRDAISQIRNKNISASERRAARNELKDLPFWNSVSVEHRERAITARVVLMRILSTDNDWNTLVDLTPLANALFSDNLGKELRNLAHFRLQLKRISDDYANHRENDHTANDLERDLLGINWIKPNIPDLITDALQRSVIKIEKICLPVLRS